MVGTVVPLLFMAALVVRNIEGMRILLNAGGDVMMRKKQNVSENPCLGGRQAMLSVTFQHEEEYWKRAGASEQDGECDAPERVALLLEHGASLDYKDAASSPMEDACELAEEGQPALLDLLLNKATKKNISIGRVRDIRRNTQDEAL